MKKKSVDLEDELYEEILAFAGNDNDNQSQNKDFTKNEFEKAASKKLKLKMDLENQTGRRIILFPLIIDIDYIVFK